MKSVISLTVAAAVVLTSLALDAQEATPTSGSPQLNKIGPAVSTSLAQATAPATTQVSSPNTESRFPNARLVRKRVGGDLDEVVGVLVSDPQGKEVRFELADGATAVAAPYDRITAMHGEEAKYPKRVLNRSSYYLTVHFSDGTGQGKVASVRLLTEGDVCCGFRHARKRHWSEDRPECLLAPHWADLRGHTHDRAVRFLFCRPSRAIEG
jgi:hypothetical protein